MRNSNTNMFFKKIFTIFVLIIIATTIVIWNRHFKHAKAECNYIEAKNNQLLETIKRKTKQLENKKNYILKILTDQEFREKLAREKLGYLKNNEFIVRFIDKKENMSK